MQFKIITSLEEVSHLTNDLPTFFDIETDGFYTNTRLVQVYQPDTDDLVYMLDTDILELEDIKQWIKPKHMIGHGLSYDFGTLQMTTERFDDTLYLARTAYPEWQQFSLDVVTDKLVPADLYEGLDKKTLQKKGFVKGAYLSQQQLKYAATDVYALSIIWKDQKIQATRDIIAYKVDILSLKYSVQYQRNVLLPHQPSVRKELDALIDEIAANEQELDGLNPNSPKQVKERLGTDSSDKATLIKLIGQGNRIAELVYKQRRLLKRRTMLTSYNFPWVETRFNPAGAATGRFTSTGGDLDRGINAQQIPRDLQYIFNMDTEDTVVVHADYSTAELRAGCSIMKDPVMYQELKAGKDLHIVAAAMSSGLPETSIDKGLRQKGKAVSFGKIFGQSWRSFIEFAYINYGVIITEDESQEIHRLYNSKYTGISSYHKEKWNNYKSVFVQTPMGRKNKARLGTDAINFSTQGCIAETMKLAVHYLIQEYPKALDYIYNIVHDAAYLRVPKGDEEIWASRLTTAMSKGWKEMCKLPMLYYKDIPMPVEVEYNDSKTGKYVVKEIV